MSTTRLQTPRAHTKCRRPCRVEWEPGLVRQQDLFKLNRFIADGVRGIRRRMVSVVFIGAWYVYLRGIHMRVARITTHRPASHRWGLAGIRIIHIAVGELYVTAVVGSQGPRRIHISAVAQLGL